MFKSKKKLTGIILLIAGVVLFLFANYEQGRVSRTKGMINTGSSMVSGNAAGRMAGEMMQGEASQYDTPLKLLKIGGIVLVILGAGVLFFGRKK